MIASPIGSEIVTNTLRAFRSIDRNSVPKHSDMADVSLLPTSQPLQFVRSANNCEIRECSPPTVDVVDGQFIYKANACFRVYKALVKDVASRHFIPTVAYRDVRYWARALHPNWSMANVMRLVNYMWFVINRFIAIEASAETHVDNLVRSRERALSQAGQQVPQL